ncbi:MAG TPA: hypothetical protein PKE12_04460 [Kiritimatiellia bacterium]|nr:hypothetical protein [Kiritimatiellia bacterium]
MATKGTEVTKHIFEHFVRFVAILSTGSRWAESRWMATEGAEVTKSAF